MVRDRVSRRVRRRWPFCGAWDMTGLFRTLRATILELEAAFERGSLLRRLEDPGLSRVLGPDLFAVYADLATSRAPKDPVRRRQAVLTLLRQLCDEVFSVETWGEVRGPLRIGAEPMDTVLEHGDPIPQRLDQVASRRFWGLGFVHEADVDATDALARRSVRRGVVRFARDLRDVGRILRNPPPGIGIRIPSHEDRRFEQLMLDILVEDELCAHAARLIEDFCQKTDLRIRYPDLDRERGARVQVKSTANPAIHEERLAAIRRRETLVILTPLTLAEFVDEQVRAAPSDRVLSAVDLRAFWEQLGAEPVELVELAYAIRAVLFRAIRTQFADARGPMASVPAALRHVIRVFVRDRAFQASSALRIYERSRTELRGPNPDTTRQIG